MFTGFEIQNNQVLWASLVAQMVKNLPAMQETQVRSIQNKPKRFIKKKKSKSPSYTSPPATKVPSPQSHIFCMQPFGKLRRKK